VRAVQVDERDASWQGPPPRFRVYCHGSDETETAGWTDTYDITEADGRGTESDADLGSRVCWHWRRRAVG
jgi:hypothetical protein